MTGYDPFAVDQVQLNDDEVKPAPSPDDMLFADGVNSSRNAPPADSSWGLLDADVDSLLPGAGSSPSGGLDFGAEVLGETLPMPAQAHKPRAAATPRPSQPAMPQATAAGPQTMQSPRREVGAKPLATGTPSVLAPAREGAGPAPAYVARKPSSVGRVGRPSMAATIVPTTLFVVGGVTAAWLFEAQQNTMMAAITFALTLVATGFARLLLRG